MKTRSEKQMFELIVRVAQDDERVRAVVLNGSRANPNAETDPFQDYDIVYFVNDVAPYRRDSEWVAAFGEVLIKQLPDLMQDPPPLDHEPFTYLMQFIDGNRIDLKLFPVQQMGSFTRDSLSIALFDRDNLFSDLPPADESDYLPKRPTEKEFHDCCNEFWWVSTYVAKGLWRDQLTYSRYMLDVIVRGQLIRMLSWHAALLSGFQKNLGANGKYLQQYVSKEVWEALRRTYCSADEQAAWGALLEMSDLFDKMAASVAESLEICFSNAEGKQVTGYLKHIKELPRDSKTIYS